MAKVFAAAMACWGLVMAESKWAPICWTDSTEEHQELLGTDTCPAVLNKHGSDEYNWRKNAHDESNLAPTMETLSCDLEGPNAEMNAFWKERHNSEWTEVGRAQVDNFAKQWGDSRQQVENCLKKLKANPEDKACLEGINMIATFGHCLKRPEKQACGECGLMKVTRDQPLVLTSKATFPAPEEDFHILVMCIDVATWSYEIDQEDFLFANHKLGTMANGDTDPHALITNVVPANCLTGEELTSTVTATTTTTSAGASTTTAPNQSSRITTMTATTTSAVLPASTTTTTAILMSTTTATAATHTSTAIEMTTSSTAAASTTALMSTTVVDGVLQCASLKAHVSDEWCTANCKAVTPFCPSDLCQCSGATTAADTGSTTAPDVTTSLARTTAVPPTTTRTVALSTTITSAPSTTRQDSPTTTAGGVVSCQAVSSQATDGWCTTNCNHSTPFCPPQLCRCGNGSSRRLRGR